ncbi:MAG: hypothetical protein A2428_02255 [Bdellovibrionales bacterium RIFOXYC1_FULL_54_43]|nr:MAG: hypothetical protein A2428_02255 [Bdellovibrionales bacterium RIFOXYC1_FULL_54_43]OFZ84321.1 MAG: hypothetical protein A2603_07390 [Bdellovibrionales bacterium RIFOXYD1_FULL_55_31]
MAQAEFHEVMDVDRDKLYAAITKYENYPEFVEGMKSVKVERVAPDRARVSYQVSMMKEISYTLEHKENASAGRVEWSLISSDSFKKNSGVWELKAAGRGKTDVRYSLELEFTFPVPGIILNRLVRGSLPSMVKGFVKRASR